MWPNGSTRTMPAHLGCAPWRSLAHDTFKNIVYKRHKLPFGSLSIYAQWLKEEHAINPAHIPIEPVHSRVKAGLKLPYPSGFKCRALKKSIEGDKHAFNSQICDDAYIMRMTNVLCDDGRMIAESVP